MTNPLNEYIVCPNCHTSKNIEITCLGFFPYDKLKDPNTATCYTCKWKTNVGEYYTKQIEKLRGKLIWI